jgi:uncharacterized protein YyaL (SSP411 family)
MFGFLAALAVTVSLAHPAAHPTTPPGTYLKLAERGIAQSHAWWDPATRWYRQFLAKRKPATNWGSFPLFDSIDAVAIADPTPAHRAAVRGFARGMQHYWNPDLRPVPGYGARPGRRGNTHAWYDDEGWLGIAFHDAYRATGDRRDLASDKRVLAFLDSAWDPKAGGFYWDTRRKFKASESLVGATLVAAYLYADTHDPRYLSEAKRNIGWADAHLVDANGLYRNRPDGGTAMPYVNGPMFEAFAVLCKATGDRSWCARAEDLATHAVAQFRVLTMGPQCDSIYIRSLLELYRLDGRRRWYDVAAAVVNSAARKARTASGRYMRAWDGRSIRTVKKRPGTPPGKLSTHAATVSVIAWMAVAKPPR